MPGVHKAVKWNSPFYGVEGRGWFLSFHTFTNYVKVAFFRSPHKDEATIRAALEPCLPSLARGRVLESVTCKYTLTPDHHFVIGLHPEHPQVVLASPCSGHGYKFASVVGEVLADFAVDGGTAHPVELFSPRRFL